MADVSKIKTPDNTTYNVKDKSQTRSDHRHYDSDLVPMVHKVYASTSYYGTDTSYDNTTWYFMSVKPDEWYKPWRIKLKVHTYCPAYASYHSYTWSTLCGRSDGVVYANWNERQNTAHYYMGALVLKKAGFDAGYGHAIGISIRNGDNYTNSAYYRTFEIDYYECENCTVTILDTPVKVASWTGYNSTNYNSLATYDAVTRGLAESGDSDVVDSRINYFAGKTGSKGIWAGSLFMEDANNTYQNVCTASDGTATASNRTTATTKKANTNGFKVGGTIYLSNTTYALNTNISGYGVVYKTYSRFDTRYSLNTTLTAGSLTAYKPLYLVGTIHSDGLFYLDTTWWTQTPTTTGKIYVLVGGVYDSTTSYCRATLYEENHWYRYDGTNLIEIANDALTVGGHTVAKDVPSNAVFTDNNTTYTFANGTNGFTVTPSGGSAQTVTVTPSITNNVTGSGTSGYLAKFNGANTITNGVQLGSDTTKFLRNDGSWEVPATGSDTKVTQTATSTSSDYEVLFSETADNTTRTEGARKNSNLKFNPSTGNLQATKLNGVDIGSSPKFTDTNNAVTQTNTTGSGSYRVLFSGTADNTDRTEGARKSANLTYNPNTGILSSNHFAALTSGSQVNSETVNACKKDNAGNWAVTVGLDGTTGGITATSLNGVTIGSSPKFTDTNNAVTQTETTTSDAEYSLLFSGSQAGSSNKTEGARKDESFTYNPYNGTVTIGSGGASYVTLSPYGITTPSMSVQDISADYTPSKTSGNWSIGSDDGVYRIYIHIARVMSYKSLLHFTETVQQFQQELTALLAVYQEVHCLFTKQRLLVCTAVHQ